MHPAQRAKQRRRHLEARHGVLRKKPGVSCLVESTRIHECYLRRYNPSRWHWLQRLVTKQLHPDTRVGYSHLDQWNRT